MVMEYQIELLKEQNDLLEMENSNLSKLCIIQKEHIENLKKQKELLENKIREMLLNNKSKSDTD